jgi:hypothetical protein
MRLARRAGCQEIGSSGSREAPKSNPFQRVILRFYPIAQRFQTNRFNCKSGDREKPAASLQWAGAFEMGEAA